MKETKKNQINAYQLQNKSLPEIYRYSDKVLKFESDNMSRN